MYKYQCITFIKDSRNIITWGVFPFSNKGVSSPSHIHIHSLSISFPVNSVVPHCEPINWSDLPPSPLPWLTTQPGRRPPIALKRLSFALPTATPPSTTVIMTFPVRSTPYLSTFVYMTQPTTPLPHRQILTPTPLELALTNIVQDLTQSIIKS